MNVADLVITIAYFSIPVQILASLWQYPRLANMPAKIFILLVLFAFFIFLCGAGHLLRCMGQAETDAYVIVNGLTAVVSLVTAIYLLPLIPNLLGSLDQSLQDMKKLNEETTESKYKLFTFMAFLCHEIRNPLFAITSSASFLGDTELTEEQEVGVGSIFDSSLLMLRLVNDVLDLSKIDAGKLELEERDFDLHRLLDNLVYNMQMQVRQKHNNSVKMKFSIAPDVPHIIFGDSVRILQIIYNLLSNSSKFTSEGHIYLEVSVWKDAGETLPSGETTHSKRESLTLEDLERDEKEDATDNTFAMSLLESAEAGLARQQSLDQQQEVVDLCIVVSDTGIGIESDCLKSIFEPYSQSKISTYRKHGGTGLGLSILSSLTKLMGGNIEVTSEVGKGSRFELRLPMKVSPNQSTAVDDSMDMTDPFLSCRRLPVYAKKNKPTFVPRGSSSCTSLHSSDCGIKFFDPNSTESDKADKAPTEKKITKPTLKKPKLPTFNLPEGTFVLVVDDNCVNRKIIGKMLTFFNIEYKEAVNGQEAVDAMKQSRNATGDPNAPLFGLVFMDLSMPVLDGFGAIEAIRQENILVPIVALTANALTQERDRALEVGANEFHTKPILRNDLHSICTRFLHAPTIPENDAPEVTSTDSESSGSGDLDGGNRLICDATVGDSYREGMSLLLRHDSVIASPT